MRIQRNSWSAGYRGTVVMKDTEEQLEWIQRNSWSEGYRGTVEMKDTEEQLQ